MTARDYTTAPVADQLGIPAIIAGLCRDLDQLRKGKISVNDAVARSMLAKQIFNGVRLYLNGTKLLAESARPAQAIEACRAETGTGSVHESAVGNADAPGISPPTTRTADTPEGGE